MVVQVGTIPLFLDKWKSMIFNRFVPKMVKGHHFQLKRSLPFFCKIKWFNNEAAVIHNPGIHKEVDELLAKGAIEPSTGGSSFLSYVFMVLELTGSLCPILNLKQFNHWV